MGLAMFGIPVVCILLAFAPSCTAESETDEDPVELLRAVAVSLEKAEDLAPLIERAGQHELVLLGEASHGTSEFYTLRADISRRLVEEEGFHFIAVEGDWPTLHRLNRYVKGLDGVGPSARRIMEGFDRWPPWMWANEEVGELIEWLRDYNAGRSPDDRVGFHGMDVYGPEISYRKVLAMLGEWHEELAEEAEEAYACLGDFADDFTLYFHAVASGMAPCDGEVQAVVELLRDRREELAVSDREFFNLKQNAWGVKNAEKHFRAIARGGPDSWNHRVDHFFETVERLLEYHGPAAKGVIWAHNTHIGDARATTMAAAGERNIGQIAREQLGADRVFSVGFGTHRGTVVASRSWGEAGVLMNVPPGIPGSYEDIMHRMGEEKILMMLEDLEDAVTLLRPRWHRAIGVVYHPEHDGDQYVPTILPQRYNAFIFVDSTEAVRPIH